MERIREVNTKHGMAKTRPYNILCGAIDRCENKNNPEYPLYGGRGIKVCERWHKFENFWEDMKEGYADDLTLDRKDPEGDYCPENCRWATQKEQQNNRRDNLVCTIKGKTQTIAQHVDDPDINIYRLKRPTVYRRINTYGYTFTEALLTPKGGKRKV